MKRIYFYVLIFCFSNLFAQSTEKDSINVNCPSCYTETRLYDNGSVHIVANYMDSLLHGELIEYSPKGLIWLKVQFTQGYRNGLFNKFDTKGNLTSKGYFINDTLNGEYVSYYKCGKVSEKVTYNMGVKVEILNFYKNGNISMKSIYYENGRDKKRWVYKKNGEIENIFEWGDKPSISHPRFQRGCTGKQHT